MSAIGEEVCIVCGGQIHFNHELQLSEWKVVYTKGAGIWVLCSSHCVDVYRLNPLAYADSPYDPISSWCGTRSQRGWTLAELREEGRLLDR